LWNVASCWLYSANISKGHVKKNTLTDIPKSSTKTKLGLPSQYNDKHTWYFVRFHRMNTGTFVTISHLMKQWKTWLVLFNISAINKCPFSITSQFRNKVRQTSFCIIAYLTHIPGWFHSIRHTFVMHLFGVTVYITK